MPDVSMVSLTVSDFPGKEETIKLTYVKQHNVALLFRDCQDWQKNPLIQIWHKTFGYFSLNIQSIAFIVQTFWSSHKLHGC